VFALVGNPSQSASLFGDLGQFLARIPEASFLEFWEVPRPRLVFESLRFDMFM
jgi:hypothetical protein